MPSKLPSLPRLLALLVVPMLGGCLEFETQTLELTYDAQNDRATLHVVYHGLHWGKGDQANGHKALQRAVDGDEFCLIDWPFHFVPKELRGKEHAAAKLVLANVKSTRVGFFKNADGQLSGGQIVTFDKFSELLNLANAEISKTIIDSGARPKNFKWDRYTRALLIKAAKSGHAWLRMNGNAVELHAWGTARDVAALKQKGISDLLDTLFEMNEDDRAGAIAWLSRVPLAWRRDGETIVFTFGNPSGRTRFVVPREGRKPYKPNLLEYAQKTWGFTLDGVVLAKLIGPDETPVGRFAKSLSLRERVRILVTQRSDASSERLRKALDELPEAPDLKDVGSVHGFWHGWLKRTAPKPRKPQPVKTPTDGG